MALTNTYSVLFGGTDEDATAGNVLDWDGNSARSFSVWYKTTAGGALFSKQLSGGNQEGFRLQMSTVSTGRIEWWLRNTATNRMRVFTPTSVYAGGIWRHLVLTYDGSGNASGVTMYMNAVAISSLTIVQDGFTGSASSSADFILGSRNSVFEYYTGNMDENSVWSKELSLAEVEEIYNDNAPNNLLQHSASANLEAWWRMGDGDTFPTLQDQVGSNDLTMVNMESGDIVEDAVPGAAGGITSPNRFGSPFGGFVGIRR